MALSVLNQSRVAALNHELFFVPKVVLHVEKQSLYDLDHGGCDLLSPNVYQGFVWYWFWKCLGVEGSALA